MGAWGCYDDQNDAVLDEWGDLVDMYFQQNDILIPEDYNQKQKLVQKYIAEIADYAFNHGVRNVLGIFMLVCRKGVPSGLFAGPGDVSHVYVHPTLASAALRDIPQSIEEIPLQGWRDNQERRDALEKEKQICEFVLSLEPDQHYTVVKLPF